LEIGRFTEIASDGYDEDCNNPPTRLAGPEFADPEHLLPIDSTTFVI
jgi:hypothetical protein